MRYSLRIKDNAGFLFLNNFQDHVERHDMNDIQFKLKFANKEIVIPESGGFKLIKDESAIFPVNLPISGIQFNYSTAQLLTTGSDKFGEFVVFFAPDGILPEFSIASKKGLSIKADKCTVSKNADRWLLKTNSNEPFEFKVTDKGKTIRFLVLDKQSALNSWSFQDAEGAKLLISEALVTVDSKIIELFSRGNNLIDLKIYPASEFVFLTLEGRLSKLSKKNELFSRYQIELPKSSLDFTVNHLGNKMEIDLSSGLPAGVNDIICKVNYIGDTGAGFINGELVADNFYNGFPWEIGLKRFFEKASNKSMVFYFRPMYKKAEFIQDLLPNSIPEFDKTGKFIEIGEPEFIPEYKAKIFLN